MKRTITIKNDERLLAKMKIRIAKLLKEEKESDEKYIEMCNESKRIEEERYQMQRAEYKIGMEKQEDLQKIIYAIGWKDYEKIVDEI